MSEDMFPGILFYKDDLGRKVPIDYFNDCKNYLIKSERDKQHAVFDRDLKPTGMKRRSLDVYKEKTLYLWVEGTEFLVKND